MVLELSCQMSTSALVLVEVLEVKLDLVQVLEVKLDILVFRTCINLPFPNLSSRRDQTFSIIQTGHFGLQNMHQPSFSQPQQQERPNLQHNTNWTFWSSEHASTFLFPTSAAGETK